jgi:hypothetical protein
MILLSARLAPSHAIDGMIATYPVGLPKEMKPGKTLSDARIKEVVTYSGYTMGKIVREKG